MGKYTNLFGGISQEELETLYSVLKNHGLNDDELEIEIEFDDDEEEFDDLEADNDN